MRCINRHKCLAFILVIVLALGLVLPAHAGKLDDYYDDLDDINDKIDEMKENRNQNKAELEHLREQLEQLEREIYNAENELEKLEIKIRNMEAKIAHQEKLIAEIEASIAETEEYLAVQTEFLEQRLCAMYKNGAVSYLEVLFSASSFSDFLSRFSFLRLLIESDTELVAKIEETKAELQTDKDLLAEELSRQVQMHAELESDQAKVEKDRAELKKKAYRCEELKEDVEVELAKLNKGIASMEEEGKKIKAEIKRLLELERVRAGNPPSYLEWPVTGFDRVPYNITSDYGWRIHPIRKTWSPHTGIDIARFNRRGESIGGKPIVAAAGGTVDFVRNYDGGGYGIYVIISHGGGYQTLYAHMRYTTVKVGDVVTMGQKIGVVGTTGSSTGNHLHFEVWVMGHKKNPLGFTYR
jgi:murein DD-endopeptidase MepM/ murein hydrolase activator NlpD